MKRILLCLLFILLFQGVALSQTVNLSACPTFSVTGPSGATEPNGPMEFTANFKDFDVSKLKLEWTVSSGQIIKGQNSLSIDVKDFEENAVVTATIKILGLPEFCPNTASAESLTICTFLPRIIDEYGKITNKEEKEHLGNFINELKNDPTSSGFIVKAFSSNISKRNIYNQLFQILKFSEYYGVDPDRIKFLIMSEDKESSKLFVVSAGSRFPVFNGEYLDAAKLSEKLNTSKSKAGKMSSK